MNEIAISGGYLFSNGIFVRGGFIFGNAKASKPFRVDSTYSEQRDVWVINTEEIIKSKSIRINGQFDYNIFFIDPLFAYVGSGFDFGTIKLDTQDNWFETRMAGQLYIDVGGMIYFQPVLFDLNFKFGLVGPTKGMGISIGVIYKFDIAQFGL